MRSHELKIWPRHFQDIVDRIKKYEVRRNDRMFLVGDLVWLREWDPELEAYTGRDCQVRITHVTNSASWEFIPVWLTIFGIELLNGGDDGNVRLAGAGSESH